MGFFTLWVRRLFGGGMKMVSWQVLNGRYIGRIHAVVLGRVLRGRHMKTHDRSQGWQSCWPQDRSEEFYLIIQRRFQFAPLATDHGQQNKSFRLLENVSFIIWYFKDIQHCLVFLKKRSRLMMLYLISYITDYLWNLVSAV